MDLSVKTLREYSRHLEILRQLRAAGLSHEVELPCICVVGVQSAGKSSVIEAMSTLKLPRGVGTCTKCPMEFYTECSDAPLSVDITLCYGTDDAGATGTKEISFKKNLTDVDEVERAIAEAQERILGYGPDGKSLAIAGTALPTLTKDCVRISAKGPNMDNLYFYDIPGVILRVKDRQDPKEIDLIHDLVKKYASKPNCIVLQVMSCEADFETGGVDIFTDPKVKARTVGVLTKADKVDKDSWSHRLMTFNNQHHRLNKGWFAVSNRADTSWQAARVKEHEFFRDSEFWSTIPEADKARLGSQNLTRFISGLLSKRVAESLPLISRKLGDNIDLLDKQLRHLRIRTEPEAQSAIITMLHNFSSDFSAQIKGIRPKFLTKDVGLVYEANRVYESIREEVSQQTPRFSLDNAPSNGDAAPVPQTSSHLSAAGNVLYLDQIAQYIELSETRELPGELPYGLSQEIITELVGSWESAAMAGFRDVEAIASKHLNMLVQTHFTEHKRGGLFADIKKILVENMFECAEKTKDEIAEMAIRELAPYTVLRAEFVALQTSLEQNYRQQIVGQQSLGDLFGAFMLAHKDIVGGDLAGGVISAATKVALNAFISNSHPAVPDATDTKSLSRNFALKVMSRTQAYLELASKRFAEVTVKCIDHGFLRKLDRLVENAVRALPINTSPQMCLEVLQDPTAFQQRRSAIERRDHYLGIKNIVDEARRELAMDVVAQPWCIDSPEMGPMTSDHSIHWQSAVGASSASSATPSETDEF